MARSLPTALTTRRALVKAAPAACVAAAVPAVGATGETKVAALYRKWVALRQDIKRFEADCEAALDRYIALKPPVPAELVWKTGAEARELPLRIQHSTGHDAAGNDVAYFTSCYWARRIEEHEKHDLHCDFDRRKLDLVKRYEALLDAAREQSGLNSAEDAIEAFLEVVWALEHDLAEATPECLADVRMKAIAVQTWLLDAQSESIFDELLNSLVQIPA